MKKISILIASLIILVSCKKSEPEPRPYSSFTYSISGSTVSFFNKSSNGVSYSWNFGDGTTSPAVSPVHKYEYGGLYNVTLSVSNQFGVDISSANVDITTTYTVYNPLPVEMDVYFNDEEEGYILDAFGSGEFTLYDDVVTIYAESYGYADDLSVVGELLWWEETVDLFGNSQDITFTVGEDFYFLDLKNGSAFDLGPFYFNCANINDPSTADFFEDIIIPNTNIWYSIGWFSNQKPYLNIMANINNGLANYYSIWENFPLYWDNDYYLYAELTDSKKSGKVQAKGNEMKSGSILRNPVPGNRKLKSTLTIPENVIKIKLDGTKEKPRSNRNELIRK